MIDQERLSLALDDCLQRMRRGQEGVEECLASYQGLRDALEPLLRASATVERLAVGAPAEIETAYQRARLMRFVRDSVVTRQRNLAAAWNLRRLVLAPALVLALIAALLLGVTIAHTPARPATEAILTVLGDGVQVERSDGTAFAANNGTVLRAGERVITGSGAGAVLTFYDGSTVTLGNDTVVDLKAVYEDGGKVTVNMSQLRGSTWTHIPAGITDAQVQIDTPTAHVDGNDALFLTRVSADGGTQVGAQSGTLQVTSGGERASVGSGFVASVAVTGQVGTPNLAIAPPRSLTIRISGAAAAYVTDPDGATVGTLDGVPVNQVSGASITSSGGETVVSLPEPRDGTYRVSVRATGANLVQVSASVAGRVAKADAATFAATAGEWSGSLVVSSDDVTVQQFALVAQNVKPAPVTIPPLAAQKATTSGAVATGNSAQPVQVLPTVEPTQAPPTPVPSFTPTRVPATATWTATATPEPAKPTATPSPLPTATPRPKLSTTPVAVSGSQPFTVDSVR